MAPIDLKFMKATNTLIAFILALLYFFSSCDFFKADNGPLSADFIVKGKIESTKNNQMLKGIRVEMKQVQATDDGQTLTNSIMTAISGSEGNYYLMDNHAFPKDNAYKIKFIDPDGVKNGEYVTLDTILVFQNPKFTNGDGSWYKGQTEIQMNVMLKPMK